MYREQMDLKWKDISERLLSKFPKLKEADLAYEKGNEEATIRKIQLRLYKSRREVL